ncbi:CRAL-TRIO domain-containing protein [Smittium mucronatum]|uniref:CRAL-TRIO domain-containing protein n=1 Tax=Smittium mucronatum TaxID=133383 RepID=A0A1R0H8Z1_9FUNG|nr:CRAL-TRIO domain-containing protein [Smittium mucronatum]
MTAELIKKYSKKVKDVQNSLDTISKEQLEKLMALYALMIPLLKENKPIEKVISSSEGFGDIEIIPDIGKKDPGFYTLVKDICSKGDYVPDFPEIPKYGFKDSFVDFALNDAPDSILLRFLRARKWNVHDAFNMLKKAIIWRGQNRLNELAWYGELHLNHRLLSSGLGYISGTERLDNPVLYLRVKNYISDHQTIKETLKYTVFVMETARTFLKPEVEKVGIIIDTRDMGLKNFDMEYFKLFLKFLSDYYPESLELVLIYSSSWVFKSIWALIKNLLDPVVASKIYFSKDNADLLHFVDSDQLLADYGGKSTYKYHYVPPTLEENKLMFEPEKVESSRVALVQETDHFIEVSSKWVLPNQHNDKDICAERQESVQKMRELGIEYDSRHRARNFYHRTNAY